MCRPQGEQDYEPEVSSTTTCFSGCGQHRLSHINTAQATLALLAHSLAGNLLQEEGAVVIAEAIVKMPQLTNLK